MLLLEAGPAFASDAVPGELGNPEQVPAPNFDWGYTARGGASTTEMAVPRGRVLGGSSAVNAAVAIRARRQDVESWQIHGVEGWAWDEVLETFKVLENTDSGDDTYQGRTGPVSIRQRTYDKLTPGLRGSSTLQLLTATSTSTTSTESIPKVSADARSISSTACGRVLRSPI